MPSLAHRLNQLGAAHAQHLISDDDYRLLRRDLFEKHAAEPTPRSSQAPKHTPPPPPQPQLAPGPPLRRKGSVALGVANLFRRATGRSSKKHLPGVQETVAVLPGAQAPANSPDSSHLAPPPRRTHRKPSLLSMRRTDQQQQQQQQQPQSPQAEPDDNPAVIRGLITSTEEEHSRLLDAFTSLELSALKRIQYKTARRLYTPTPTSVNVLIEGREWRKHTKPVPSIVLPPPSSTTHPINHRSGHSHHSHHPLKLSTSSSTGTHTSSMDQVSINSAASGSSSKISLSRSLSSIPRNSNAAQRPNSQPHSPLSPYFRASSHTQNLQRHDSVSSASTQSTGASSRLHALGQRSTGNLYHLASLAERTSSSSSSNADTVADSTRITVDDNTMLDDADEDPEAADYESAMKELNDIRRRREELNTRFASRLEFLKAKLRAAELHERVMRR